MIKAFPAHVIQKSVPGKPIYITSGTPRPAAPGPENASGNATTPRQVVIVGSTGTFAFEFDDFPCLCNRLFINLSCCIGNVSNAGQSNIVWTTPLQSMTTMGTAAVVGKNYEEGQNDANKPATFTIPQLDGTPDDAGEPSSSTSDCEGKDSNTEDQSSRSATLISKKGDLSNAVDVCVRPIL